jgi:hypothetical protein
MFLCLQLPHDDQILSQSENLNTKHFFEFKGNAQLKAFFVIKGAMIEHSKHHGKWARSS